MDPVEINAGRFYLRALRHDGRVDDLPAVREFEPGAGPEYVERRDAGWAAGELYSWAVCAQTDVELLAEVDCVPVDGGARVTGFVRPGSADAEDALAEGTAAVRRFTEGHLGLTVLD